VDLEIWLIPIICLKTVNLYNREEKENYLILAGGKIAKPFSSRTNQESLN
jgi:hypothetical protein